MSSLHPLRDATLRTALAASIVAHVAVFAALGRIGGGSSPSARTLAVDASTTLEARLVMPPLAEPSATPEPAQAQPEPTPAPAPPDPVASVPPDPPLPKGTTGDRDVAAMRTPRVVLSGGIPAPRLGDALLNGALDGFPIEVDGPVVVPDRIEIPYPPGALAAGQEATVLAWAVIAEDGAVEATHVVEGPPEFGEAVELALAKARFIPAHNGGTNIRFYVTLAFEFRIDSGGTVAVDGAQASTR